jgi:asparagine synthase (glutamine-hydrolysing)
MSAIAGIIQFDGAPIDPVTIRRITARLRLRAPDHVSSWIGDSAALFHATVAVTPGSEIERQPLVGGQSGLVITFDGRLDNRDEIIDQLALGPSCTDAAVVLAAAEAWGDEAASRLLGDFALAAWTPRTRRLLCARDISGVRALHYRIGPGWIAFASTLDVLVAGIAPMPAINEGMAAEYLASFIVSQLDTLFQDVFRLPAAHRLTASSAGRSLERYWSPDPKHTVRYSTDAQFEEHLRELMQRSVACRLRTARPVAVMLSGGIDSSAVTAIAASLVRERAAAATAIETLSLSVEGDEDERPYFEQVCAHCRVPSHRIHEQPPRPGQFFEEVSLDLDAQIYPHSPTVDRLRGRARELGARVLLTGMGGDDWLGTSPAAYADLVRSGSLVALASRLRADAASADFIGWRDTIRLGLWPLVPSAAKGVIRRGLGRGRAPAWLDPAFAARAGLEERLSAFRPDLRFTSHEIDDMWFLGTIGMTMHTSETVTRGGDRFGIEHWHPFRDRRIIEFGLGLPPEQLWRDGRPKDLLRRAMAPLVPTQVATRTVSPSADHTFMHAIESESGRASARPLEVVRRGWVDARHVAALQRDTRAHYDSGRPGFASGARILWGILAVNLWLDAISMVKYDDTSQEAAGV